MKLIIGLQNPGKDYENTRHNAGSLVIDHIAEFLDLHFKNKRTLRGEVTNGTWNDVPVVLLKPRTFMNNSGMSVRAVMDFYHIDIKDIIVVYDDADLPLGTVRMREKGSSGGHNGMNSIIEYLGSSAFTRLRLGIGRPENEHVPLEDWVLGTWTKDEQQLLPGLIQNAVAELSAWIS